MNLHREDLFVRNSVGVTEPGKYEATIVKVRLWRPGNVEEGADFVLQMDTGEKVVWYAKAFAGPDGDGGKSLKYIMHFLRPYDGKTDFDTAFLLNRFIGVILERKVIRSREVPVIIGFFFSTKELFRLRSNSNGKTSFVGNR
jgi:hypothetical protein